MSVRSLSLAVFLGSSLFSFSRVFAVKVEIIVNAPAATPALTSLFLAGDSFSQCSQKANCQALTKIEASSYSASLDIPAGLANFKVLVTRGDWNQQAANPDGSAHGEIEISVDAAKPTIIDVVNWTDLGAMGVTGRVDSLGSIYSPQLGNSREVSVWLPPSYVANSAKRYPVIYLHDGQNVFNPRTSTWGIDWGVDETMTRMIAAGEIPEAILVAVDGTQDREAEYDYSKKGLRYADFLIQILKPVIDSKYRTLPDRKSTFLMGSSMGALISATILWHHPEVFSRAAGLSFAAHYDSGSIFRILEKTSRPKDVKLYADFGDTGYDEDYEPWVMDFEKFLLGKGFPRDELSVKKFPFADHNEAAWSRRVRIPLLLLLKP